MDLFTARDLAQACRIFLELAYPSGLASIPAEVRPYAEIAADAQIADYLPPAPVADKVCQKLHPQKDGTLGLCFRFGRIGFRFLKLRVQQMDHHGKVIWVYSVDTHDKRLLNLPNQSAEEIESLRILKHENEVMKTQIEKAFDRARILTPTELLRIDLVDES